MEKGGGRWRWRKVKLEEGGGGDVGGGERWRWRMVVVEEGEQKLSTLLTI